MEEYPTPIALAYQRFHDAKFNIYERRDRLIALYEYTTFFVFNLVFADLIQRLDPIYIKDGRARNAYKDYGVAGRINFVKAIIEAASTHFGVDLFTPELVSSLFVIHAERLREMRNHLAHKGTASESALRKLLEEYEPIINKLLSELEFLMDYRLVRIPSIRYKGGKYIYQMTVYQGKGTVPSSQDERFEQPCPAEHDHLVMLNNRGEVLDLHPLYQLFSDETTQHEEHVCFLKSCKEKEQRIYVESIQTSVVHELDGFDALKNLAEGKLLTQQPKS